MIAAHMDEIGLIVTKVEETGFLRFAAIGGIDPRTLVAQEVTVLSDPPVDGFIGVKPPHLLPEEERDKAIPIDEMFIDVGMSGDEARRRLRPGGRGRHQAARSPDCGARGPRARHWTIAPASWPYWRPCGC